jgi:hypothetical protein
MLGAYTASRSIVFNGEGKLFSIKMPTNFPVGDGSNTSEFQGEEIGDKDLLNDLIEVTPSLYQYFKEVEKRLAIRKRSYKLQLDIAQVIAQVAAAGGNGFIIRDLNEMNNDGFIPIPVHSVPLILDSLSQKAKMTRSQFLKDVIGRLVARAQTELYLDYGIELQTPHMQQFVLPVDSSGAPQDFLYIRNLTDSSRNGPIFDFWRYLLTKNFWFKNKELFKETEIPQRTLYAFLSFPTIKNSDTADFSNQILKIDRFRGLLEMKKQKKITQGSI